jgi:hypothetical protein
MNFNFRQLVRIRTKYNKNAETVLGGKFRLDGKKFSCRFAYFAGLAEPAPIRELGIHRAGPKLHSHDKHNERERARTIDGEEGIG